MKKLFLYFALLVTCHLSFAQSLDKLISAPTRPAQGDVAGGVGNSQSSADGELRRRAENQQKIDANNSEISQKVSQGKSCQSNCYKVERSSSDKVDVRCLVGAKSGSSETVWKYKSGGFGYSPNGALGAQFKSFDEAARFVCGQ